VGIDGPRGGGRRGEGGEGISQGKGWVDAGSKALRVDVGVGSGTVVGMPEGRGESSQRARRAPLLAGISVLGAVGVIGAYGGCGGVAVQKIEAPVEVAAVEGARVDAAVEDEAGACATPIVIEAYIAGSYTTGDVEPPDMAQLRGPALVTRYSIPKGLARGVPPPRSTAAIHLAAPFFAAEFSAAELCSTEEASPSALRFVCLGPNGRPMTVEYRIEGKRSLVITTDHPDEGRSVIEGAGEYITPMPPDACATLISNIPRRDLSRLQKAYLDDSASARCEASKGPRRKVPATLRRAALPADDPLYESGLECTESSTWRCCHNVTSVHLALPPTIGPSEDLGVLDAQCYICSATRLGKPNGAVVGCNGGLGTTTVQAYQLGDDLYVIEGDHVRRVPLPCGVALDFRLAEFVAGLAPGTRIDEQ